MEKSSDEEDVFYWYCAICELTKRFYDFESLKSYMVYHMKKFHKDEFVK